MRACIRGRDVRLLLYCLLLGFKLAGLIKSHIDLVMHWAFLMRRLTVMTLWTSLIHMAFPRKMVYQRRNTCILLLMSFISFRHWINPLFAALISKQWIEETTPLVALL